MKKTHFAKLAILTTAIAAIPALSFAGTAAKETKTVIEKAKESCVTGDIGIDVYSQYIFHGITLENQGAILQPYADLYFRFYEGEGALTGLTLNLGIWNSFHSRHPSTSSTRSWYEFDFLAGLSFEFAKNFTFSPMYYAYTSPGDYFDTSHNLRLTFAYNDADLLGKFALNPYFYVEFELDGKAGNGSDEGVYYEVGITPSFELGPIEIGVPIKAGFGSSDYYAGDTGYGFFSAGITATYAMTFVPECLGEWSLSAGATYFHFGDANDDANEIKGSDESDFVFNGGLKVAF
jgi:hypothetical protein